MHSMADVQRYTVTVGGRRFSIVSDEDRASVDKAAHAVDQIVTKTLQQHSDISFEKAAVLAALKLSHDSHSLNDKLSMCHTHSKQLAALIDDQTS